RLHTPEKFHCATSGDVTLSSLCATSPITPNRGLGYQRRVMFLSTDGRGPPHPYRQGACTAVSAGDSGSRVPTRPPMSAASSSPAPAGPPSLQGLAQDRPLRRGALVQPANRRRVRRPPGDLRVLASL